MIRARNLCRFGAAVDEALQRVRSSESDELRRRAFEAYRPPCALESGSFPRCPWNPTP